MKQFVARISRVYRTEVGMREHTTSTLFLAKDKSAALDSSVRLAQRLDKVYSHTLRDPKHVAIGYIRIDEFRPGTVDERGYVVGGDSWQIFEWKYDWPGAMKSWVDAKKSDFRRWDKERKKRGTSKTRKAG